MHGTYFTSVTRISDLAEQPFEVEPVSRDIWATGDYCVGRVKGSRALPYQIEVSGGRLVEVHPGDKVVGALGARCATLQNVGTWKAVGGDLEMDALSMGGVLGKATSLSPFGRQPIPLQYLGHAQRGGTPVRMDDFVDPPESVDYRTPTVLIIGSSMEAGKTLAAKRIVRALKNQDKRVVAAKLTGVGRHRDTVAMGDAGADAVFDFVDAGLPSTVTSEENYLRHLRGLLALMLAAEPEVVVAEAGASPLEPYNVDAAVDMIDGAAKCVILCASDPFAVVGVMSAFDLHPDLVSGRAASTSAAVELVERLTDVQTLNLADPDNEPALVAVLNKTLGV